MGPDISAVRPIVSVRVLLNQIIDYAGLFPPAKLDMQSTVERYNEHLAGPESWMVGRLIVPVERLDEFESSAAALLPRDDDEDEPWELSAITVPAGDPALAEQLDRIAIFNESHGDADNGLATIDLIELKGDSIAAIESALDLIEDDLFPFFELPSAGDPRGLIASLAGCDAGAKIRTGGITADQHPDPADVARFLSACAAASVPFKATAGLHQPIRHFATSVQADQFGFLNLFLAAIITHAHGLDQSEIVRLLEVRDASAFELHPDRIYWNDHIVTVDEIEDARFMFALSFGSCSIDEPADALRDLEII